MIPPSNITTSQPADASAKAAATEKKLDGEVDDILADFDSLMSEMDSTHFNANAPAAAPATPKQ